MKFTKYTLLHWAISGINNNHVDLDSTIVCCTPWHKSYTSHSRVQSNKNYIVMWPIRSQSIHNSNKLQSFQNQSSGLIMFSISTWSLLSNNRTINHIQYNNGNENLKIHINFTYSKQFQKSPSDFWHKKKPISLNTPNDFSEYTINSRLQDSTIRSKVFTKFPQCWTISYFIHITVERLTSPWY